MKIITIIIMIINPLFSYSQNQEYNLLYNGDFEMEHQWNGDPQKINYIACPPKIVSYYDIIMTPDIFSKCKNKSRGLKYKSEDRNGSNMVGMAIFGQAKSFPREYIILEVKEKLKEKCNYLISFDVLLEPNSSSSYSLGVLFTEEKPNRFFSPLISSRATKVTTNLKEGIWERLEIEYFSDIGGQKYLILGDFKETVKRRKRKRGKDNYSTYIYVDNVIVSSQQYNLEEKPNLSHVVLKENENAPSKDTLPSKGASDKEEFIFNKAFTINFKSNSAKIEDDNFINEVKRISSEMIEKCPTCKIRIVGHTDNDGTQDFNLKLSLNRADSVRSLFISNGVPYESILTEGQGESKPLVLNNSIQNKRINRRVEIVINKLK